MQNIPDRKKRECLSMISTGILLLLLFVFVTGGNAMNGIQEGTTVRPMAVAGQFYPKDQQELSIYLKSYFDSAKVLFTDQHIQSVIVPHAGYIFSGRVAADAFAQISQKVHYDHIFLIGPSHHVAFDGASVCNAFGCYATPLGRVEVDTALCNRLITENQVFQYLPQAHDREHCLEVQLPFLQYHLKDVPPIIPIIIGTEDMHRLREIAKALQPYFNSRNLFVISSDFSHYPPYDDAEKVDHRTGDAIATGSLEKFAKILSENHFLGFHNLATSACGQCGIAVLLMMSENNPKLNLHKLIYLNSGDSPYGEKKEVVGYYAFCQTLTENNSTDKKSSANAFPIDMDSQSEKKTVIQKDSGHTALSSGQQTSSSGEFLTSEEKKTLLILARNSISSESEVPPVPFSSRLMRKCGAFVTLNENGRLRGCIGHFGADIPLADVVREMARSAAFEDPRFTPVNKEELSEIEIEISVLTPLHRITDISEFQFGKQGIYMRKGFRSGTFLPQVADEVNWTKEEFLGHCAQDKAGIGWEGWKNAELYTYEAIIFSEKSMGIRKENQ